jgi:hypothetical protein
MPIPVLEKSAFAKVFTGTDFLYRVFIIVDLYPSFLDNIKGEGGLTRMVEVVADLEMDLLDQAGESWT